MSTTTLSSAMPRRFVTVLVAALFGLTLALNPVSASTAHSAVSPGVAAHAVRIAAAQAGVRYVWGGTTPRGFDCSGLTRYAYAHAGKGLPRTSQQQFKATIRVRASQRRLGDLVFFHTGSRIYHVGIYAGNGMMWHAPRAGKRVSKVRIWTSSALYNRVR